VGRAARAGRAGVLVTIVAIVLAAAGAGAAPAAAAWSRPFDLAPPGSLDDLAPALAFAPSGAAAASFGVQDVDTPGVSQAYLSIRSARGAISPPTTITGAQQILALAYDGSSLELLTGSAPSGPSGLTCCSSAGAVQVPPGGATGAPRTLVGGLTGATLGQLLTLGDGQMLAAVATERGVWVVQSSKGDRFGVPHLLTGAGQMPESMSAAWLGGESTIVAWTQGSGVAGMASPQAIETATGTRRSPPRRARVALTVPAGHRIDELAVTRRGSAATVAWIESWYDRGGAYHSVVQAADLTAHPAAHTISPANRIASGLSLAADAGGDQAASWQSCTAGGACTTEVATRGGHGGTFGSARSLGAVDPGEPPSSAVSVRGQMLVGWVAGGHPLAAVAGSPSAPFGAPRVLSSTVYALQETVAFGPAGQALAAWTQGTLDPSVVGAFDAP
jgi:hypothetical protein